MQSRGDPSPVPLAPGEVLLYEAGWGTRKSVLNTQIGTGAVWAYAAFNAKLAWSAPELALLQNEGLVAFVAFAGIFSVFLVAGARAAVRHAVLTADGLSLRLYPFAASYGALGGFSEPTTVPIRLLSLTNADGDGGRRGTTFGRSDSGELTVAVRGSETTLLSLDKPAVVMPWVGGAGCGLVRSPRGFSGALPDPQGSVAAAVSLSPSASSSTSWSSGATLAGGGGNAAASASSGGVVSPSMMASLPPATRSALRDYALLVHVLSGRTVDPHRLADGAFEFEEMAVQLDPAGAPAGSGGGGGGSSSGGSGGGSRRAPPTPTEMRVADLRYWRRAVDPDSQREYWWHVLTSHAQWSAPTVDGKGPLEWHPELLQAPAPAGTAASDGAAPPVSLAVRLVRAIGFKGV